MTPCLCDYQIFQKLFEGGINFLLNNFRKYSGILSESDTMFLRSGINTGVSQSTSILMPLYGCIVNAVVRPPLN